MAEPEKKPPCKHEELHFETGGLYIRCSKCSAGWRATLPPNYVVVNPEARSYGLNNKDVRKKP